MKLLLLVFMAFTLPYAALWHNRSAGDRQRSSDDEANNNRSKEHPKS